jgi:anaerobic dimethyl sulfoxide reductase subunit B (iron-sulfur subunit)
MMPPAVEVQGDDQLCFLIDTTRCINCKTCEIACKDFHAVAVGQQLRRVRTCEEGEFPNVRVCHLSMSCNHCENPLCVAACPVKAYHQRPADGLVLHDPARCIGCQYCTWACPYAAPQYDEGSGKVQKCNLCSEELAHGREPVCVLACPMRAIKVGKRVDVSKARETSIALRSLPSPQASKPTTRFKVKAWMLTE